MDSGQEVASGLVIATCYSAIEFEFGEKFSLKWRILKSSLSYSRCPLRLALVNDSYLARFLQGLKNSLAGIETFGGKYCFGHHQRQQLISSPISPPVRR
jgi:hypothetical protein